MALQYWMTCAHLAEDRCDRKQYAEASQLADRALQLKPNCAVAHHVLGIICLGQGRPQEAIDRLARALAIRPDLARSHLAMGGCWMFRNRLDNSISALVN
jgi:tetratricopeptide (TPR) repeat protein